MFIRMTRALVIGSLTALGCAATSGAPTENTEGRAVCNPGHNVECRDAFQVPGIQTCLSDGTGWTDCQRSAVSNALGTMGGEPGKVAVGGKSGSGGDTDKLLAGRTDGGGNTASPEGGSGGQSTSSSGTGGLASSSGAGGAGAGGPSEQASEQGGTSGSMGGGSVGGGSSAGGAGAGGSVAGGTQAGGTSSLLDSPIAVYARKAEQTTGPQSTIKFWVRIKYKEKSVLSDYVFRYWYTNEGHPAVLDINTFQVAPAKAVTLTAIESSQNGNTYMAFGIPEKVSVDQLDMELSASMFAVDGGTYDTSDDWSRRDATNADEYRLTDRITAYRKGVLIYGVEPPAQSAK